MRTLIAVAAFALLALVRAWWLRRLDERVDAAVAQALDAGRRALDAVHGACPSRHSAAGHHHPVPPDATGWPPHLEWLTRVCAHCGERLGFDPAAIAAGRGRRPAKSARLRVLS